MTAPLLFKILVDNQPRHGGAGQYPEPGTWTDPVTPICCETGYHLTSDPLRWWTPKAELWIAEPELPISGDSTDKAAFARVRLIERITPEWPYLCMFPRIRAFLAASARSFDPKADITFANLSGANLYSADLSGANLSRADLSGADLSHANLYHANLYHANLSGANLYSADLSGANLSHANLSGANLSGANLSHADLSRAYLYHANLSGAYLSHANLSRADLYGTIRESNPPSGWAVAHGRLVKEPT